MILNKTKNNKGFVILFAVTISAIVLSIALSVANVAYKELKFTSSARDSNDALLAADTGAECALLHDKLSGSYFPVIGGATAISCVGQNITPTFTGTATTGTYNFTIPNLGSLGTSCAKVTVFKEQGEISTAVSVTATGYNVCDSANLNRVERQINISSYVGNPPPLASVVTNNASPVANTSATLNGSANPNGYTTTGWFRYSTISPGTCNDSFGTRSPASGGSALGNGSASVAYSSALSGLSLNTTYYYCAIASSISGTSFGEIVSFTTIATATLTYTGPVSGSQNLSSGPLVLNTLGEYIVTPNVDMTITVKAWGGGGGTISPANRSGLGGGGGFAESSISLISGTPYKVWVAGGGAMSITGGFGGGGNGGAEGGIGSGPGGGGGGSSVFFDSDNTTRKVAAGGGGGGGSTGDGDASGQGSDTDSNAGAVGSNGIAGNQNNGCAGGAAAGLYTGNASSVGGNGGDGGRTGTPEQKIDNAGGGGGGGGGGGTGGGGGKAGGLCSGGGGGGGANLGSTSTQNGSGVNPGNNFVNNGWDGVAGIGGNGVAGNRGLIIIQ